MRRPNIGFQVGEGSAGSLRPSVKICRKMVSTSYSTRISPGVRTILKGSGNRSAGARHRADRSGWGRPLPADRAGATFRRRGRKRLLAGLEIGEDVAKIFRIDGFAQAEQAAWRAGLALRLPDPGEVGLAVYAGNRPVIFTLPSGVRGAPGSGCSTTGLAHTSKSQQTPLQSTA